MDRPHANNRPLSCEPVNVSEQDIYLFNEGTHRRIYEFLGAQQCVHNGRSGVRFAVWAPNAQRVELLGDFNGWGYQPTNLHPVASSGIWAGFLPELGRGSLYKYRIHSSRLGYVVDKSDPIGIHHETPPRTASVVWDLDYQWEDDRWLKQRSQRNGLNSPVSIYEVHLGSWRRMPEQGGRSLTYRELAVQLVDYVVEMGFTHVEFLPVMEHPYDPSWGYQITGYFAPTSRFGTPQDFMYLVDKLHQAGIGVILDWAPAHFPSDQHGLAFFDGTHLYEHEDPRLGFHPDWRSCIFNYGRNEVRSFLTSSALYWFDRFHVDGLRVDAVASMLYLDYSREAGQWVPNREGGRENLEAISLLQYINTVAYEEHPHIQTIAEESTAWQKVSRPVYVGGLGFGMKWDMGWMHDTLTYLSRDPIHRQYHHNEVTFRAVYAQHENFVLPLSHDEVVHGKRSLLEKLPGDDWQKFANLRLLLAYQWALPGKKLLFMGCEFAQRSEWNFGSSLDWHLLGAPSHSGVRELLKDLNTAMRDHPALHELDFDDFGFEWVEIDDGANSVLAFTRRASRDEDRTLIVLNFTPIVREGYRLGVEQGSPWRELLNTDAARYGGSGVANPGKLDAEPIAAQGRDYSLALTLPPLAACYLVPA